MFNASALRRYPGVAVTASVIVILSLWAGPRAFNAMQQQRETARLMTQGDASRAPVVLRRFGCSGCHDIPGISGADGKVGGSLSDIRQRVYVGGVLNNTSDNLVKWIVSPQTFSPRTAMPVTGISEAEARDVAAYLYSR
jgi:cytochrome c2